MTQAGVAVRVPDGFALRVYIRRREISSPQTQPPISEYPTRRLAERALERGLSETEINSLNYPARPTTSFREFGMKWQKDVLSQLKPSTRSADKSRIFKHLIPEFGDVCMKDLHAPTRTGHDCTQGRLDFPQVPPEPHCAIGLNFIPHGIVRTN